MRLCRSTLVLIALAAAASLALGAGVAAHHCRSAIEQLADYNTENGAFSYYYMVVQKHSMTTFVERTYAKVAAQAGPNDLPPVLLLPTNRAMMNWIAKHARVNDPAK